MAFGLVLKCYEANVVHTHQTFIGTMLLCTHFLKKNVCDIFRYFILEKVNQ